jgi:hypothetical protein
MFLLCSKCEMTDRPASWRMPSPKQIEKLAAAAAVRGSVPPVRTPGPGDEMPPEYWQAVLDDPHADASRRTGPSIRTQRLSDIQRHLLRVACRRCGRTVEIQKADAVRLAGTDGPVGECQPAALAPTDHGLDDVAENRLAEAPSPSSPLAFLL